MSQVDFYYDFSCPWSYLALLRMQDVSERNRARLELKPVSIERVLDTENPARLRRRFAENPAKASWQRKDLQDWAVFWGITIDFADNWPQNRDTAAAASLAAIESGHGLAFSLALFRAEFRDQADTNSDAVLRDAAAAAGADPDAVLAASRDAARIATVQNHSLQLIERGGFGTPSMFVDDSLFYGNDRVPLVEWTLGPMADEDFVLPGQHNIGA